MSLLFAQISGRHELDITTIDLKAALKCNLIKVCES